MRLTFELLGWTLDWSLAPTATEAESEFEEYQDAGTIGSERVTAELGFGEVACSPHFFDPGEGDEDRRIGFRG